MRYLPTGLTSLDRALLGGIRVGTVTELVGRAGAGKTNFALQLCVLAAKFNQGAMYIDTEKKLVLQRLHEISRERFKNKQQHEQMKRPLGAEDFHDQQENNHDSSNKNANMMLDQEQCTTHQPELFPFKRPQDVLTNLTVKTPGSTEELIHVLEEQAEMEILQRNHSPSHFPVRLLVVDSIAAPLKRDFGSDSAPQRAAAVFGIAQTLKRLADQLHLAVVVLNQVGIVDNNNNNNNSKNASWGERGGNSTRDHDISVRAALGTSWHHCVSTRLLMEHQVDPHRVRDDQNWSHSHQQLQHHGQGLRHMSLVKSNAAAFSTLSFEVTAMGVVEASSSIESEHQQIQQE